MVVGGWYEANSETVLRLYLTETGSGLYVGLANIRLASSKLLSATFIQTFLFLTFLTVAITITIVFIMFGAIKSKDDKSQDLELLVDDGNFSENSYEFNLTRLTLPRKVFCLNFRQILEGDNYFALNT